MWKNIVVGAIVFAGGDQALFDGTHVRSAVRLGQTLLVHFGFG